ncbi:hypothetical protein CNEO4_1650001 [Clostridium neonatale]|nr:hypothetical protein CNEO3_170012 [Clostridium neonatale]CAI3628280.1 hypothetical protein CNEO4_1650001 [Clostridium neonatale]CAI4137911.1 hypothetical protein CNEO4_1220001 [Clostridium neonatale]
MNFNIKVVIVYKINKGRTEFSVNNRNKALMCGSLATKMKLRIQTWKLASTNVCSNVKLDKQLWNKFP